MQLPAAQWALASPLPPVLPQAFGSPSLTEGWNVIQSRITGTKGSTSQSKFGARDVQLVVISCVVGRVQDNVVNVGQMNRDLIGRRRGPRGFGQS